MSHTHARTHSGILDFSEKKQKKKQMVNMRKVSPAALAIQVFWGLALTLALAPAPASACPFDAPCDCSPMYGLGVFLNNCAADEPGGAAACVEALVHAGINTTVLQRNHAKCGYFSWCDHLASSSCTAFTTANGAFRASFCTGKCRPDGVQIATATIGTACLMLLFTVCIVAAVQHCGPCQRARLRQRRAHAASYMGAYGSDHDDVLIAYQPGPPTGVDRM